MSIWTFSNVIRKSGTLTIPVMWLLPSQSKDTVPLNKKQAPKQVFHPEFWLDAFDQTQKASLLSQIWNEYNCITIYLSNMKFDNNPVEAPYFSTRKWPTYQPNRLIFFTSAFIIKLFCVWWWPFKSSAQCTEGGHHLYFSSQPSWLGVGFQV